MPVRPLHRSLEVLIVPKPCAACFMRGLKRYTASLVAAAAHIPRALEWGARVAREGEREGLGEIVREASRDAVTVTEPCSLAVIVGLILYSAAHGYALERGLKGEAGLLDAAERLLRLSTARDSLSLLKAAETCDAELAACLEDLGITARRVEYESMSLEDVLVYAAKCRNSIGISLGRNFRRLVSALLREWGRVADNPLKAYALALSMYAESSRVRSAAESLLGAGSERNYISWIRELNRLCREEGHDYSHVAVAAAVAVYAASLV